MGGCPGPWYRVLRLLIPCPGAPPTVCPACYLSSLQSSSG